MRKADILFNGAFVCAHGHFHAWVTQQEVADGVGPTLHHTTDNNLGPAHTRNNFITTWLMCAAHSARAWWGSARCACQTKAVNARFKAWVCYKSMAGQAAHQAARTCTCMRMHNECQAGCYLPSHKDTRAHAHRPGALGKALPSNVPALAPAPGARVGVAAACSTATASAASTAAACACMAACMADPCANLCRLC